MRYEHDNSAKWDPKNRMKTKSPEALFMGFLWDFWDVHPKNSGC